MQFYKGQILVCTKSNWKDTNRVQNFVCPKEGDFLSVYDVVIYRGETMLSFYQLPAQNFYHAKHFRGLDYDFVKDVLKKITPHTAN